MGNVKVSVIMCVYNTKQDFFDAAVESIIKQTFADFELLIIDDGSDYFSLSDQFCNDSRIVVVHNKTNKGISFSRNVGLSIARGKYIAIMDSDDIAENNRLAVEFEYMEKNINCVACGTWFRQFGEKNNECKRIIDDSSLYKARLLFDNNPTLLDPSCMIRKSILDNNNIKYNESMKSGMDYMMWVKLSEYGEIHNIKAILMNYRTHPYQITKKDGYKKFDLIVKRYQFSKIDIMLSNKEENMAMSPFDNKNCSLKEYRLFLDKILSKNEIIKYYDQPSLMKATEYQWQRKIIHTKNIFRLIKAFFCVKKQKSTIVKCVLRHFGFFKRMDNIIDGAR